MRKIYPLFAFLLCISCSEEFLKKEPVSANLNVLKFNNTNEIFSLVNELNEAVENPNARVSNDDFESFDDVYKQALTELSESKSIEKHDSLLQVYSDVLTLFEDSYVPKIGNSLYRVICNRDRLYEAEGYVHKVFDDQFIVSAEKTNALALLQVTSLDNLDPAIFRVINYQDFDFSPVNGKTSANCGTNLKAVYFDNNGKCSDDRRSYVRAYTYYVISGNNYTPAAISESWGELRNWLCNWKEYATILRTRNCSFDISFSINGANVTIPFQFADYNGDHEQYSHNIWNGPLYNSPIVWTGGVIPTIYFSRIHEEATTRGVGYDHFAILDCQ